MGINQRNIFLAALIGLTVFASGCGEVKSPVSNVVSGVESLFSSKVEGAGVETGPSQEAQAAYSDAQRLGRRGARAEAFTRLSHAASLDHPAAAYELGMLHTQGRDTPKNLDAGARWVNRAADLGDARAQYLVGANLMSGASGEKDAPRGIAFLARAGEQGHVRAQYLLGQAYVDGAGVEANPAWAARWYGRAARAGHTKAQYSYGVMYASALGVPKNIPEAYRWLLLAFGGGHKQAETLAARIAKRLSNDTINQIKADAKRFIPRASARLTDVPTVMYVQYALNQIGHQAGPVDGLPGARTRAGIRSYLRDSGTPMDDQITRLLLDALIMRTAQTG